MNGGNKDPLAALAELRRREEELMRMNQELDKKNQDVLKGVLHKPKITDSELAGVADEDVDFKDLEDDEYGQGLRYDYSQVNPYDKSTLKNSEMQGKKGSGLGNTGLNSPGTNPYLAHLKGLEENDNLVDSLQLDPRRDETTLEDRGRKFLAEAGQATKAELLRKADQVAELNSKLADQTAINSRLQHEVDGLKSRLGAVSKELSSKDEQLRRLEEKALGAASEAERLTKELKAVTEKHEAAKLQLMDAKRQLGGLTKEKQGAERENTQMGKTQKKFEGELAKKEQR